MTTANYIRVSTKDQNTHRQLIDVPCDRLFIDRVSGAERSRPALDELIVYLREGDTLNVHSIDRLGRNFAHMVELTDRLYHQGVAIVFHSEGITLKEGDHTAKLIFHIMASIAESERARIKDRQREGIAAAQSRGKQLGRKDKLTKAMVLEIQQACLDPFVNKAQLAKTYGISRTKLYITLKLP